MTAMTTNNESIGRTDRLVGDLVWGYAEYLSKLGPEVNLSMDEKQLLLDHGYAVQDTLPGLEDVR